MTILNQSSKNVNNIYEYLNEYLDNEIEQFEFNSFVSHEIEQLSIIQQKEKELSPFFNLIPNIHLPYVRDIIAKQFHGNAQAYIDTVPLFKQLFTTKHRDICNAEMHYEKNSDTARSIKRQHTKERKELLLWSAQLLKLIGGKRGRYARSRILSTQLTSHYKQEMIKSDEYINSLALISADGKFTKLPTNESKQKQKLAKIKKRLRFFDSVCKFRNFTWSLITLTLPPSFHCNPTSVNAKESFSGVKPSVAYGQLQQYWKLIRANFALDGLRAGFNDDYFGYATVEAQKDSTMHLHAIVFHSHEDTNLIHSVVRSVQNRSQEKVKFDISLNNGKSKASSYVFKYVMKTNAVYTDCDNQAMKTTACRYYYSARGFSFFGDNNITQFDYLYNNYQNFENYFSPEMKKMFREMDYFTFSMSYAQYFDNVYVRDSLGNRRLLGVSYKLQAYINSLDDKGQRKVTPLDVTILISKKQYCIFEKPADFDDSIASIHELSDRASNIGIETAFNAVTAKQSLYDEYKDEFFKSSGLTSIDSISNTIEPISVDEDNQHFAFINLKHKNKQILINVSHENLIDDDLIYGLFVKLSGEKQKPNQNLKDINLTVNQPYSRKRRKKPKTNPTNLS